MLIITGAPSLLLVGPSAAEANALIRRLPAFNEARPIPPMGRMLRAVGRQQVSVSYS